MRGTKWIQPTNFLKFYFVLAISKSLFKSGLSLAKSLFLRYQLENKSIRPTLINFFSKCKNRENHQPLDHTLCLCLCLSLSLSLSLYIYIDIYILQKKLVNQPSRYPNFIAHSQETIRILFPHAAFCKSKEQQKKRQCNLQ